MHRKVDAVIIGGGPAGLAAACELKKTGIDDTLIIERDDHLGGILQQCIHNGFGLHWFKEELTGPEYAYRFLNEVEELNIETLIDTMVLEITPDKIIRAISPRHGLVDIEAKTIILAMGCRERTAGAIMIPGSRPAGVYTAGMAQRLLNIEGYMPGSSVVILGSGDIGLIMARRMKWEGADVKMVCEIMPWSSGLARNIHQCLHDNDIPLKLQHTVVKIHGDQRIEGVTVARVDDKFNIVKGSEEYVECDTLLLSVGLIPENELTEGAGIDMDAVTGGAVVDQYRQTTIDGIFACGNVLQVHDLVDYVSEEAVTAAKSAARYIKEGVLPNSDYKVTTGNGISYALPQYVSGIDDTEIYYRPKSVFRNGNIVLKAGNKVLVKSRKFKVAPGEMERIVLKSEKLKDVKTSELTIEWEDNPN